MSRAYLNVITDYYYSPKIQHPDGGGANEFSSPGVCTALSGPQQRRRVPSSHLCGMPTAPPFLGSTNSDACLCSQGRQATLHADLPKPNKVTINIKNGCYLERWSLSFRTSYTHPKPGTLWKEWPYFPVHLGLSTADAPSLWNYRKLCGHGALQKGHL